MEIRPQAPGANSNSAPEAYFRRSEWGRLILIFDVQGISRAAHGTDRVLRAIPV